MGVVTGLPPKLCVALAGFAKAIISIPGGLKAVVYTDVLQTVILFAALVFSDSFLVAQIRRTRWTARGDAAGLFSFLGTSSLGVWNVIGLILVLMLNPVADPSRRLTMYSAGTERSARLSMVISGIVVMIFSVTISITGMYAFKLNPHLPVRDQALLAGDDVPPWLAAFVAVAVVSGISSAANGTAAAAGTL